MSLLLNFGRESQAARSKASASARPSRTLKREIVVNEQGCEKRGQIKDRVVEGLPREAVAVGELDAQRKSDVDAAQHERSCEIQQSGHPGDIRKQAGAEQHQRIEHDLQ